MKEGKLYLAKIFTKILEVILKKELPENYQFNTTLSEEDFKNVFEYLKSEGTIDPDSDEGESLVITLLGYGVNLQKQLPQTEEEINLDSE